MRRLILNTLAALSLILLLPIVTLAVRSAWVQDSFIATRYTHVDQNGNPWVYILECWHGEIGWRQERYPIFSMAGAPGCRWEDTTGSISAFDELKSGGVATFWGFGALSQHKGSASIRAFALADRYLLLVFPVWAIVLLLSVAPVVWLIVARRRTRGTKRSQMGLCPVCGYDLRASSGVCPECGTPINRNPKIAQSTWRRETKPLALAALVVLVTGAAMVFAAHRSFDQQHKQWVQYNLDQQFRASLSIGDAIRVQQLLDAGAKPTREEITNAMWHRIMPNFEPLAIVLMEAGADLSPRASSVLSEALTWRCFDLARALIERGVKLNMPVDTSNTELKWLAGNLENRADPQQVLKLAELMLAHGADPNLVDQTGVTPLHMLAMIDSRPGDNNTVLFAKLLLDHGARVNQKDEVGRTPLNWARFRGRKDLADFLVSNGASE